MGTLAPSALLWSAGRQAEASGLMLGSTLESWACYVSVGLLLERADCKDIGHGVLTDGLRSAN